MIHFIGLLFQLYLTFLDFFGGLFSTHSNFIALSNSAFFGMEVPFKSRSSDAT